MGFQATQVDSHNWSYRWVGGERERERERARESESFYSYRNTRIQDKYNVVVK